MCLCRAPAAKAKLATSKSYAKFTTMTKPKSLRTSSPKPRTIDEATETRIQTAHHEFMEGRHKTVKAAASAHDVPYLTLTRRIQGTACPKKLAHDKEALLTRSEKNALLDWVQYLGVTGHPVSKRTLRPKIHSILHAKGYQVKQCTVSKTWIQNFLKENKERVKLARGNGLDTKRAQVFNYPTVHHHFTLLSSLLESEGIPWENVYNMDEKGIQLGGGQKNSQEKFFFSRSDMKMYKQKGDSLELVTVIDCVCADGTAPIKPGFVFAGATKFDKWFDVDDDILCVFHSSDDTGLTTDIDIEPGLLILNRDGQMMRLVSSGSNRASYLRLLHATSPENPFYSSMMATDHILG